MTRFDTPSPARLAWSDKLRLGSMGLLARKARTGLSALGIAVGITAFIAVLGLSASSKADLMDQLNSLGTDMLTVAPGKDAHGMPVPLPRTAPAMVARATPVERSSATYTSDAKIYRNSSIPAPNTGGMTVLGADLTLPGTVKATLASGRWLDSATNRFPAVVLGKDTAIRLGVTKPGVAVWLGDERFTVLGVLNAVALAPELDSAALIGTPMAQTLAAAVISGQSDEPAALGVTRIYVKVDPEQMDKARMVLSQMSSPDNPNQVSVSRPSDALAAQAATDKSLTTLSLGLGAIGLLIGGIGVANVMVISVMERRREIGVRRSLGATKASIRSQFLLESVFLALIGGGLGVILGVATSAIFSTVQGWRAVIPFEAIGLGLIASVLIGMVAGAYPAARATRIAPTEALRTL